MAMPRQPATIAAAALALVIALLPAARADAKEHARASLPTTTREQDWQSLGLRIGLAASYGGFIGLDGAPGGHLVGGNLRIGVRLDARWSLYASFNYQVALSSGGLSGLRYSGTLEPTWHVWRGLSLSVGLGFGGIVEASTGRADATPLANEIDTSYTFPDASTPLSRCSGVGLAAVVRAEYRFQLGRQSSTGPAVELTGQWTGCAVETGNEEPDTAEPIVRRQWWPHIGASFSWIVVWR
ncbi:MAG: hypothetical protein KC503_08390 [Myxococcales bacterium]|nr:hypothetical protein [Myxococcales bacterium]